MSNAANRAPDLFDGPFRTPPYPDGIPVKVCDLFESLAFRVHRGGFDRYSADALLHRIRWHFQVEKQDRDFRANNNWTATLARWFIARNPHMEKFFELRESKHREAHD